MADAFYTLQLLHLNDGLQALVQPEKGGEKDAQYFGIVLNAIKNRKQLAFTYLKHWEPNATYRTVAPYLLKEAGRRWYLIGKDVGGNQYIKHFALDRMSDVYETDTSFTPPTDTAYADLYQHTFGIDGPHNDDEVIQDVVLSFDHYQGKYVKALPLHPSQEEIIADEDTNKEEPEYRIRLCLYITRDLVMKILSYGDTVKVLQPQVLAKQIREELQRTFKQYK